MKWFLAILIFLTPLCAAGQSCNLSIRVRSLETNHETVISVTELRLAGGSSINTIPVPLPDGPKELACSTSPLTFSVGSPIDPNALIFGSEVTCEHSGMKFSTGDGCQITLNEKSCLGFLTFSAYDDSVSNPRSYSISGMMTCHR